MCDMLIRGVPETVRRQIRRAAEKKNTSVNQILLNVIKTTFEKRQKAKETEKEKDELEKAAFRRLEELRERLYQKYGLQEDSTKLIRHFRDTRNRDRA